jgi:hypothetical protein
MQHLAAAKTFMKTSVFSRFLPLLAAGAIALALGGCATEMKYSTTTSDGQRVTFHFVNGMPAHASEAGIQTDTPKLEPNPKIKKFLYLLRFFYHGNQPPRSVKVEDVSDDTTVLLAEDTKPEIRNNEWRGVSRELTLDDPGMKWLNYVDASFRVYRFTIVLADGRTVVLHEGIMVPAYGKSMLRQMFGEKP